MGSAGRPALTPDPSPDSYPSPEGRAREHGFLLDQHDHGRRVVIGVERRAGAQEPSVH